MKKLILFFVLLFPLFLKSQGVMLYYQPSYNYEMEATNLFKRLDVQPSDADKVNYNSFIKSLKINNIWQTFDALYVCFSNTITNAKLNLVSTSYNLVPNTSDVPFTAYYGFIGDGVKYYKTGLNLSTATHYKQNDACINFWGKDIDGATSYSWGVYSAGAGNSWGCLGATYLLAGLNGPLYTTGTIIDGSVGFNRTNSTGFNVYTNGKYSATATNTSVAIPNLEMYVESANGLAATHDELYFLSVGSSLTAAQIDTLNNEIRKLRGTLNYTNIFDQNKLNNGLNIYDKGTYTERSPESSFKFSSNTEYLSISAKLTWTVPDYLKLTAGTDTSYIIIRDENPIVVHLATGTKTIEITEAGTSGLQTDFKGTFIKSIKVVTGSVYTIIQDTVIQRLCFIGNSITNGWTATYEQEGFPILFRNSGRKVSVLGYGVGGIYSMTHDSPTLTQTISWINQECNGSSINKLIILLGVNDYAGLTYPTLGAIQTAYGNFLDAIHTARPDILIYCITPLLFPTHETDLTPTLPNYRTAITNAVSTRTSFASVIDGYSILTPGSDYGDWLHPSTTGHKKIYDYLKTLF